MFSMTGEPSEFFSNSWLISLMLVGMAIVVLALAIFFLYRYINKMKKCTCQTVCLVNQRTIVQNRSFVYFVNGTNYTLKSYFRSSGKIKKDVLIHYDPQNPRKAYADIPLEKYTDLVLSIAFFLGGCIMVGLAIYFLR